MSRLERKRIRIDWEELEEAFSDGSPDHRYYLDRETGAVHFFSAYLDNEDEDEEERTIGNEGRYVLIPHERRLVAAGEIAKFVGSLDSEEERSRLQSRLSAPEARRRFDEIVAESPVVQSQWQRFVSEGLEARIKTWLTEVAVEPID
jgi:hypothetical protein